MSDKTCKRVVLIVKASKVGERALDEALKIMDQEKCEKLSLLFVVDEEFFKGAGASYLHTDELFRESMEEIGRAILDKMEMLIKKKAGDINYERIVLHGKTAEEILKFVKSNQIDILVLPRDRRGPIERFLIGGDITPFIKEIEKYTRVVVVE